MTVKLDLTSEVEEGLRDQAQAEGLSLEQFLNRTLATLVRTNQESLSFPAQSRADSEQREHGLEQWLDSFPQRPVLSDEAVRRENWYPDR